MAKYRYDAIIIGGFGHVGLPLGIALADAGLKIALYDIADDLRESIQAGRMPFLDEGAEEILQRVIGKTLHVADGLSEVSESETIFITVGTPLDEHQNPKIEPILELCEQLIQYLNPDHRLILRSTVCPGTTKRLNELFETRSCTVHLAYCPERIAQGHAVQELGKLPQIVSGFTDTAVQGAEALFKRLGAETIELTVEEAELAKLFVNAWRYIQFAITNQFYMIATEQNADYSRIYHAMTHNYERASDFPGPGFAAGPCLLKDTLQLAAFYGNHFQLGHSAMLVNEGLPNFISDNLIPNFPGEISGTRVGILGMAFKADTDDTRDSLSYRLAKILRFRGAVVVCSDDYVQDESFVSKEELVETCPIVIVGVPHSSYKELAVSQETHLVDLWGVIQHRKPAEVATR